MHVGAALSGFIIFTPPLDLMIFVHLAGCERCVRIQATRKHRKADDDGTADADHFRHRGELPVIHSRHRSGKAVARVRVLVNRNHALNGFESRQRWSAWLPQS